MNVLIFSLVPAVLAAIGFTFTANRHKVRVEKESMPLIYNDCTFSSSDIDDLI